jgi:NAD(P)-dependent dehydrogenase (short-subunit alcohol dehydrogenase family)
MTDKPLSGRLALVTGASRGIGAATAEALGAAGAHVILTARTAGGLEEVEERIHTSGGTATIAPLDLAENDSIARLGAAISGRWQALDILVLNAATLGTLTPVPSIEAKELAQVMTLNLLSQQAMLATFDGMLRASDRARVIGLSSGVATRPRAYWGAYAASKAALDTLLLCYADEVRQISNIRVALLNPGATATRMRARAFPGEDAATLQQPSAVAERILSLVSEDFETGARVEMSA